MKIRAYAKINLSLDVVRKREDGYHDLEMMMAPCMLHDLIHINYQKEGITITTNRPFVPTDERNIMYKVAKLMIERFNIPSGIKIHIFKNIPIQAGLGGGSSDGAAVLRAMNMMFSLGLSDHELAEIGKEVGADIPFCIYEKLAFVEGVGDKLEFIKSDFDCNLLLVKPKKGVSTKQAFELIDIKNTIHPDLVGMKQAMKDNDYDGVIRSLGNSLEIPSIQLVSDIGKIKEELIELGFDGSLMSGSGSCVFGITRNKEIVDNGYRVLRKKYPFVLPSKIKKENEDWKEFMKSR